MTIAVDAIPKINGKKNLIIIRDIDRIMNNRFSRIDSNIMIQKSLSPEPLMTDWARLNQEAGRMSAEETISIQGTLLMLDDATPHVAVPVQVMRDEKAMATVLSDEHGRYQFVNLEPGQYQLRCHVPGAYIYYGGKKSGEPISLRVKQCETLKNIDFRIAPFKKGTWRTYNYLDGLAGNSVWSIHRDSDGFLWFGTSNGVSRYDGKRFTNFTTEDGLAGNTILAIYGDSSGILWFGTDNGISRHDGKGFVNFTIEDGLAHNVIRAIYGDSSGILWFGTDSGISRHDGKGFVNFTTEDGLAHNKLSAIHVDSDGILWLGTDNGVSRYDGKGFINFTTEDGLAHNAVLSIHSIPDGILWFGTNAGVSRYDGKEFVNFTSEDGLAGNIIYAIHSGPDGILWFGTDAGVSRYDGKGFVNLTTRDGLAYNAVRSIHSNPDGTLWFGGGGWQGGGGLSRYDRNGLVNFTITDGLVHNRIEVIHSDTDGVIWFGTEGGASRCDGEGVGGIPRFVNFTTEDGLANNLVASIYGDPDGVMWFGTRGGVSQYDGKEFVSFTEDDGLANNIVWAIHRAPDGVMWFGTLMGISLYDGTGFVTFTEDDGLAHENVTAIHRDSDGVMWFGTFRVRGVFRYDGHAVTNFTTEDGLLSNKIEGVFEAQDGVLFATPNGVSRYDGEEFVNLTSKDGLAFDWVHAIHRSVDGIMWFGTLGGGVSGYDGVAWTSLDTRDGLGHDSVFSIVQDSDGFLWFGTENGTTRYRRSSVPPMVQIVSVTSDRTYRDLSAIPAFTPGTRVTIEYSSTDFKTIPEKRQYRYQMAEGDASRVTRNRNLDLNWQPPTRETNFDWIPDKTGTYTFAVQAIDRDLNYSEPATLSLTVQPDPKLVSMQMELDDLRQEISRKYHFSSFIGKSAAVRQVHALMERAIDSGLTVLITGETGTGKELVARAIHHNSPRRNEPMLDRNCGAIPSELLTSELFGHRKGAFTGANEDKIGLFDAASGGTVQLDEIGEMPQDAQVHLLRFLEEREVQRLGENIPHYVDVRIIATTNRDLAREVAADRFREDLYYRLSEFPIHIPPLRERSEDIPLLAEHFLQEIDRELSGFAPDVFDVLQSYSWPGNVRELRNTVRRAVALAEEGKQIQTYHFPSQITRGESLIQDVISDATGYKESVDNFRRRLITQVLKECDGNRHEAARRLNVARPNLIATIKRLGIKYQA
jgi:DNA-binding NtrC family response regulator/ligand-binding sensor domain-containing protein